MAQQYYSVVTRKGAALEAAAKADGRPINFTEIAVGDGGGLAVNPSAEMEGLVQERWRGPVSDLHQDPANANVWVATAVIPRTVGGFTIREAGLFTDRGLMYAIGKTPNIDKVSVDEGASGEIVIRIRVVVSPKATVHLLIDPSQVLATREYVDRLALALHGVRLTAEGEMVIERFDDTETVDPADYQELALLPRAASAELTDNLELILNLPR
ncbi:MAG: phage tail protein [Candidatus Adiutrix sp.]|jgi:phage-related tail fiber protein|nr:phage tail protein [Candidatus Adiutrix sp.]